MFKLTDEGRAVPVVTDLEKILNALGSINARRAAIVKRRFIEGATWDAVAGELPISRERVRQLSFWGLRELDHRLHPESPFEPPHRSKRPFAYTQPSRYNAEQETWPSRADKERVEWAKLWGKV